MPLTWDQLNCNRISFGELQKVLQRYPDRVPEALHRLDEQRFKIIPDKLEGRKGKDTDALLEKKELVALVEWKLKHGTYRPKLASLVASNTEKEIRDATKHAFKSVDTQEGKGQAIMINETFASLTKLKGIGPATASLILSCYDPLHVPFFSDELFRYVHESLDWRRKIGYTKKEYIYLAARFSEIQQRLEQESGKMVTAVDLEKVAYVLGKESQAPSVPATARATKRAAKDIEQELVAGSSVDVKRVKK